MAATYLAFIIFLFFWNTSPGPLVGLVSRNAVKYGFPGGFATILGILMCDVIYMILAFIGVSEFIEAHEKGFKVAKIIGCLYIIYIGFSISWNAGKDKTLNSAANQAKSGEKISVKKIAIQGFLTDLSNPLTIVGMASYILQFIKPSLPLQEKMLYIASIPVMTILCFGLVTFIFANKYVRGIILPKIIWFERVAGVIIIMLSVFVLLDY